MGEIITSDSMSDVFKPRVVLFIQNNNYLFNNLNTGKNTQQQQRQVRAKVSGVLYNDL